jgi:hypothetical protein
MPAQGIEPIASGPMTSGSSPGERLGRRSKAVLVVAFLADLILAPALLVWVFKPRQPVQPSV